MTSGMMLICSAPSYWPFKYLIHIPERSDGFPSKTLMQVKVGVDCGDSILNMNGSAFFCLNLGCTLLLGTSRHPGLWKEGCD